MSDDPRKVKEGVIVNAAIRWLIGNQCDVIRNNSGAIKDAFGNWIRFGKKGTGDVLAISPYGRWIEVECKTNTGDLKQEQFDRLHFVRSRGGVYVVARGSVDNLEKHKPDILATAEWTPWVDRSRIPQRSVAGVTVSKELSV